MKGSIQSFDPLWLIFLTIVFLSESNTSPTSTIVLPVTDLGSVTGSVSVYFDDSDFFHVLSGLNSFIA